MDQDVEFQEILRSVAEKSLDLIKNINLQPEHFGQLVGQWSNLSTDSLALSNLLINHSNDVVNMQCAYWQDAIGLWKNQCQYWEQGKSLPIADKRFNSEAWVNNPFFNMLSQHYLLAHGHINSLLEHLELHDKQQLKRVQFLTQQYLNALSPANYLHTNPELMSETLQSQGKNLLVGLQNLLTDIDAGSARLVMSLTDKKAFSVGENIAITPGKVVYRNELMELIQYSPQTAEVNVTPLLIIPPWINKYYILDLSAHNSLVGWLVSQGITVFMISWVNPDASHANKGLADYLQDGPLAAIALMKKQLNVSQVNALGFCIGGTLLAMLLAYEKARQENSIHSATFLASLIDFSEPGEIGVYIDEDQVTKLEEFMQVKGYLDGELMAQAFNSLRASDLIWTHFIRHYLHGKAPAPFDLLFWNSDSTNMPAKMHSEYLRWMYLQNDLIVPNQIHINNIPLNIQAVDTPTFFLSTKNDHIAPWKTVYRGFELMPGEKCFVLGGSGHVAGIVIPPGTDKYGYYVSHLKSQDPDEWLKKAQHHSGSWWNEWFSWLGEKSGKMVHAPLWDELPIKAVMDAPGSYVLK